MSRLVHDDRFLDCIRKLHASRDLPSLRSWLLDTAPPKLGSSDWLSCNEVDLRNPASTAAILKPESPHFFPRLFPRFREVAHQHLLIARQLESPNFPVHKIPDFLPQEEYHQPELDRDVHQYRGVEYQIAATIKLEPDRITAIALSRQKEDDTERDRAMLELLRPHLALAFNQVAQRQPNLAKFGVDGRRTSDILPRSATGGVEKFARSIAKLLGEATSPGPCVRELTV